MTTTTDPAAYLEAALTRATALIEDGPGVHHVGQDGDPFYRIDDDHSYPLGADEDAAWKLVAGLRRILELHGYYSVKTDRLCTTCGGEGLMSSVDWPCDTVKALAAGMGWTDDHD